MKLLTLNLLYLIIKCQPNQQQRNNEEYRSEQNQYNVEQQSQSNLNQDCEDNTSLQEFLLTILIVGLGTYILQKIFSKKKQIAMGVNSNIEKQNLDEQGQKLNSLAQKLQAQNIDLKYTFNNEWVPQTIEKLQVQQNGDKLTFQLIGSDPYGTWNQTGLITINKYSEIETFSRKIYDNHELQGGDVLMYFGRMNEEYTEFKGGWYYLQSKDQGEWQLTFKAH